MEVTVTIEGGKYVSKLNGEFHSFPYYDEQSKSVKYHPTYINDIGKFWHKNGKFHSYNDEPAIIYKNGDLEWYKDGNFHRDGDKPAIIRKNGDMIYCKNGFRYKPNINIKKEESLEFFQLHNRRNIFYIKTLVPAAIFYKDPITNIYTCWGKLELKNGLYSGPVKLTLAEQELITSKGYEYKPFEMYINLNGIPFEYIDLEKKESTVSTGSSETLKFHKLPDYANIYYIKELVPDAIFMTDFGRYLCVGKLKIENGDVCNIKLNQDEIKLITSKGYEYQYNCDIDIHNKIKQDESSETLKDKEAKELKDKELKELKDLKDKELKDKESKELEESKDKELKESKDKEEPIENSFKITIEDAVKFILNSEDLTKEERSEFIKNIFDENLIFSTREIIAFLLNCKIITPTEKNDILRLTSKKIKSFSTFCPTNNYINPNIYTYQ